MMDWQQHFGTQFFTTWQQAGLPHHEPYLPEYFERLGQMPKQAEWVQMATTLETGIDPAKLFGVYSFGATVGKVLAALLNVDAAAAEHTADWCGRLNAGISLFDYISDEMHGASSLITMHVFQPFTETANNTSDALKPIEALLSALASSVLHDLPHASSQKLGNKNDHVLFKRMQKLFDAEQMISNIRLAADVDTKHIRNALMLKSAGPFRLMAEYTAYMADAQNEHLMHLASTIGNAIGHCYWWIDDAKDLKIDFDECHWNIFLQQIAAQSPKFFAQPMDSNTYEKILVILENSAQAQKVSTQITRRLKLAIRQLEVDETTKQHAFGILSASLWQWYYY